MSEQHEGPASMRTRRENSIEIAVTIGLLAFVGYYLLSIQGLRSQARMFPTVILTVCTGLLVLALIIAVVKHIKERRAVTPAASEEPEQEQLGWVGKSLLIPVVLIAGSFAIKHLGLYTAMPFLVAALFWLAGSRPWWLPLALALPVTGIVWLVFDQLIGITLPR